MTRTAAADITRTAAADEVFLKAAITTVGIASAIARHLPADDVALKGLFLLTNDARLRHELRPACALFASNWKRKQERIAADAEYRRQERENMRTIMATIRAHIEAHDKCVDVASQFENLCELYEYLCEKQPSGLYFMGKRFASLAHTKLYEFEELLDHDVTDTERREKLYDFETRLEAYFDWGATYDY